MAKMSCVFFRKYRNSFAHTNSVVPILELWRFEHTKDQVVQQPEILVNQEWVGDRTKWKRDFGRRGWHGTKEKVGIQSAIICRDWSCTERGMNMYEPEMNTVFFFRGNETKETNKHWGLQLFFFFRRNFHGFFCDGTLTERFHRRCQGWHHPYGLPGSLLGFPVSWSNGCGDLGHLGHLIMGDDDVLLVTGNTVTRGAWPFWMSCRESFSYHVFCLSGYFKNYYYIHISHIQWHNGVPNFSRCLIRKPWSSLI